VNRRKKTSRGSQSQNVSAGREEQHKQRSNCLYG
jgi:hypothetical protein